MSVVKDMSLAAEGREKIAWVRDFMPTLGAIEKRLESQRPFEGVKISLSVHMEAKTANLALVLQKAGAEVWATGCNPLSTQDAVAAGLASMGVNVFAVRGVNEQEYTQHLKQALSCKPNLIIDDGGDLVYLLSEVRPELGDELIGGGEETTTGVRRLQARADAGQLRWPMMNVNDARSKHYFDNKYGTGQSVWDAIMHSTNLLIAGKVVVVAGYGYCGRGIAIRAKGLGADVIVTEVDPFSALEAVMDGCRVMSMEQAAPLGDIFVCATGCKDIIVKKHFPLLKNNAFLCNAGHFNLEVDTAALESESVSSYRRRENIQGYEMPDGRIINLLAEGRLVNLASGNGHPAEIMDLSFALQVLCLEYMLKNGRSLSRKVYKVPDEIDREVSAVKLRAMGISIDSLSGEQESYLSSWLG